MEEKDPDAQKTAFTLMNAFPKAFRSIYFTVHPAGVNGESQGKSSNISWAARQASSNYREEKARRNCVITIMDGQSSACISIQASLPITDLFFALRSGHSFVFQLLLARYEEAFPALPNRRRNTIRHSHNIRSKRSRRSYSRPDCGHPLVWGGPVRVVQELGHLHPYLGLFDISASRRKGRWLGHWT